MADKQKTKSYEGRTDEERDAMKERAKELKSAGRRGSRAVQLWTGMRGAPGR